MKNNKTLVITAFFALFAIQISAQGYNRISIDLEGGVTKPMDPFTHLYFPELASPFHVKAGVRVMGTPSFGLKASYTYEYFTEGSGSLPFKTTAQVGALEGVLNIGRACNFEEFSKHIGLSVHAGVGLGFLQGVDAKGETGIDRFGSVLFGISPQIRLTEKLSILTDISMYGNTRQDHSFDFKSVTDNRGFDGYFANISAGISLSLGKNDKNIDWKFRDAGLASKLDSLEEEIEALKIKTQINEDKLSGIDSKMLDDDNDGVANYLDEEKDTKEGAIVDTKGKTISLKGFDDLMADPVVGMKLFYTVQLGVYSN
ncbi:MAG: hypothetical protein KJ941_03095, partial [Bacteroidetes bacterium]|nr:hypothetical protein [Bacteroidota bacterium]